MNYCKRNSVSSSSTESSSKCSSSCMVWRKGSDNTNVCRLAPRSHVRGQRVRIVSENAVDCPKLRVLM